MLVGPYFIISVNYWANHSIFYDVMITQHIPSSETKENLSKFYPFYNQANERTDILLLFILLVAARLQILVISWSFISKYIFKEFVKYYYSVFASLLSVACNIHIGENEKG